MPDLWTPESIMHAYVALDEERRIAGDTEQMGRTELDYYHELEPLEVPSADIVEHYIGPIRGMRSNIGRRLIDLTLTPTQLEIAQQGRELITEISPPDGFPIVPRQKYIRPAAREGKIAHERAIKHEFGTLDKFYGVLGLVTYEVAMQWTDQEWKDNFDWLRELYKSAGKPQPPINEMIGEAGPLHIAPTDQAVVHRWQTFGNYGRNMRHESKHQKRLLSPEGFRRAVIDNALGNGGYIDKDSVAGDRRWLSRGNVKNRAGGIQAANISLDRITGTRGWDKNMYLWWGWTHFVPKMLRMPRFTDIEQWSAEKKGPSPFSVLEAFDRSIDNFVDELAEAEFWQTRQIRLLGNPNDEDLPRLTRHVVVQALRRNPDLFHIERDIEPDELKIFYELFATKIEPKMIARLMRTGISFKQPRRELNELYTKLDAQNLLSSRVLRLLEPYILGLAPPRTYMSWSDCIKEFRTTMQTQRSA